MSETVGPNPDAAQLARACLERIWAEVPVGRKGVLLLRGDGLDFILAVLARAQTLTQQLAEFQHQFAEAHHRNNSWARDYKSIAIKLDTAERDIAEAREACPCVRRQDFFDASLLQLVNEEVSQLFRMQSRAEVAERQLADARVREAQLVKVLQVVNDD